MLGFKLKNKYVKKRNKNYNKICNFNNKKKI